MSSTKENIKDKIDKGAEKAKDATEKVTDRSKDAARKAGEKLKDAGDKLKLTLVALTAQHCLVLAAMQTRGREQFWDMQRKRNAHH
jgi:hypothetical protein